MTRIDINTFIGRYPFRDFGPWGTAELLDELQRADVSEAWVSHLGAIFQRDPAGSNTELYALAREHPLLKAIPAVHPGLPEWGAVLDEAIANGVPAVRCDPTFAGLAPTGGEMLALVAACAERSVPLMMAVRLEDGRQRHPNDIAPELAPWMLRSLIRSHPDARLIITHADREFIEQVHFGSTPDEAARMLWDISWIWGPPEDHLGLLLRTVGLGRFTFGTGIPLRLAEPAIAKLDLLDLPPEARGLIESGNLRAFCGAVR